MCITEREVLIICLIKKMKIIAKFYDESISEKKLPFTLQYVYLNHRG